MTQPRQCLWWSSRITVNIFEDKHIAFLYKWWLHAKAATEQSLCMYIPKHAEPCHALKFNHLVVKSSLHWRFRFLITMYPPPLTLRRPPKRPLRHYFWKFTAGMCYSVTTNYQLPTKHVCMVRVHSIRVNNDILFTSSNTDNDTCVGSSTPTQMHNVESILITKV